MASYDATRDKVEVLGGRLISVQRAKHLISELESAVETAEQYEATPELHDIGTNEYALNYILDPPGDDADHVMKVEMSFNDEGEPADEYFIEVVKEIESHNLIDAHVEARDIPRVFEESTGLEGFHVEMPDT